MILNKLYLALGIAAVVGAAWLRYDYVVSDRDELKMQLEQSESNLKVYRDALISERESAARVAALSQKNIEDLNNAKSEIDRLRLDVESGDAGLQVNAECPEPRSVPSTGTSTGTPNATGPRLSNAAQRDYFTLRDRHAEATAQITGLQQYILSECTQKSPQ
jgi:prophage endopeptidase